MYRFRLSVKPGKGEEEFQIKVSKKSPGSPDEKGLLIASFIRPTETHNNNLFVPFLPSTQIPDPSNETICFAWTIPGVGFLKVSRDGSVFFDQGSTDSMLIDHGLVLKTSGKLFVQSLKVHDLTLKSKETRLCGAIATSRLIMDYEVVNDGGMNVKEILGKGHLINHGLLNCEGVVTDPAILGVRQITNEKSKILPIEARINGTNVHLKKENTVFYNHEDAYVSISHCLTDDPNPNASFVNKGNVVLGDADIEREVINHGFLQAKEVHAKAMFKNSDFGEIKLLARFISRFKFTNDGEITAKRMTLMEGHNKGKLTTEECSISREVVNEGHLVVTKLCGDTLQTIQSLKNCGKITGKDLHLTNCVLTNETSATIVLTGSLTLERTNLGRDFSGAKTTVNKGTIKANVIYLTHCDVNNSGTIETNALTVSNSWLQNLEKGTIRVPNVVVCDNGLVYNSGDLYTRDYSHSCGELVNKGRWDNCVSIKFGMSLPGLPWTFSNTGTIKTGSLLSELFNLPNDGTIEVNILIVKNAKLHNKSTGVLDIRQRLLMCNGETHNEGQLYTRGISQISGDILNTGQWEHQGDELHTGSAVIRNNNGTMIWRDATWNFNPCEYVNMGKWQFDNVKCSQPITIHNYDTLQLKNSSLTFNQLLNAKDLLLNSGQYVINTALQNNGSGIISFLENNWTFTDDVSSTAPHRLVLRGSYTSDKYMSNVIESQKNLEYHVQQIPHTIRAQGDVTFAKRHAPGRRITPTYNPLQHIISTGKVTFWVSAVTFIQPPKESGMRYGSCLESPNIKQLELNVDGPVTLQGSIKAPTLTLNVSGDLICGKSNEEMGTIASIEGPLTITAHSIDGRYGKFYGKGVTTLRSTKADITLGESNCVESMRILRRIFQYDPRNGEWNVYSIR